MALTPEEAAAVLRRAAELDTDPLDDPGHLDEHVLRDAAREVGLSGDAVERAVRELRAGQLAALPELAPARWLGLPARAVVERVLGPPPAAVEEGVRAWLGGQWLEPRRAHGSTQDWVPRRGTLARARRAVDVQKRLRLRDVTRLRVSVAPVGAGTRVHVVAELDDLRRGLLGGGIAAPAVVAAGAVVLLLDASAGAEALAAGGSAAAAGGAGWGAARRTLVARRARLAEELEVGLDGLLAPRPGLPAWVPPSVGSWAKRLRA